jgi:hypothetical protein
MKCLNGLVLGIVSVAVICGFSSQGFASLSRCCASFAGCGVIGCTKTAIFNPVTLHLDTVWLSTVATAPYNNCVPSTTPTDTCITLLGPQVACGRHEYFSDGLCSIPYATGSGVAPGGDMCTANACDDGGGGTIV